MSSIAKDSEAKSKNKLNKNRSKKKRLIPPLLTVVVFLFLVHTPPVLGEGSDEPPDNDKIIALHAEAKVLQRKTKAWNQKMKRRDPATRVIIPLPRTLPAATKVKQTWTKKEYSARVAYKKHWAQMRKCRQAGFPRWYCPIVISAAKSSGVPSWAFDPALAFIIRRESGFNPKADNPSSTAFGLFQMLTERSPNPTVQTKNGIRYIKGRYGSPSSAQAFWRANHWY